MTDVRIQFNGRTQPGGRLNVLLTENRPHAPEHWTGQLPRLLRPQGIVAYLARSAQEAIEVADQQAIHAAVIDLATPREAARANRTSADARRNPMSDSGVAATPRRRTPGRISGAVWLTDLFKRLPDQAPVVIVNSPTHTDRQADRLLHEALKLGAFSVMNKPVALEQLLAVLQRLLERRYEGTWPTQGHRSDTGTCFLH